MGEIKLVIDGAEASGREGMTILDAAGQIGIEIPTLCHSPELTPTGVCRICVVDEETEKCVLRKLADDLEGGAPRFAVRESRSYLVEEVSPYIWRDMSKCILCRKCIGACSEIAKKDVFSMAYRGFRSKVIVDFDEPLNKEICRDCGICIDYCPTGALSRPKKGEA